MLLLVMKYIQKVSFTPLLEMLNTTCAFLLFICNDTMNSSHSRMNNMLCEDLIMSEVIKHL